MEVMKQGLIKLHNEKQLTDFTIRCGPHTFEVHKNVVVSQSEYFAALPRFAGITNSIDLKAVGSDNADDACDDPEAIKIMVHFFYHHDYRATESLDAPPPRGQGYSAARSQWGVARLLTDGNMVMHARVYAAACKYRVPALEATAAYKFKAAANDNWDHHSFAEATRIVYTTTPDDKDALRKIIVDTIHQHPTLLSKPEVHALTRTNHDLMYAIFCKNYGVRNPSVRKVQVEEMPGSGTACDECGARPMQVRECSVCSDFFNSCCESFCPVGCVGASFPVAVD